MLGYHAGDYFAHRLNIGEQHDEARLPAIFYVNWFRRAADGSFLWPGFGENSRVLKWMAERLAGTAAAVDTPIGLVPVPGSHDVDGDGRQRPAGGRGDRVDAEEWRAVIPLIEDCFARSATGCRPPSATNSACCTTAWPPKPPKPPY